MDIIKTVEMSTTPSDSSCDNITTTLLIKCVTATNNDSATNEILTESRFQYQNVMPGDGKTDSSNSILTCSD